jgi:CheY-like chemotaxis protein
MSKRVLVVEDQPDNRQIIRDMLAPTHYEITEAEDGEQALTAVETATRSHTHGCSTADHRRLRGHAPNQGQRAAGCDDYVPEPYSPRQLLAKIQ